MPSLLPETVFLRTLMDSQQRAQANQQRADDLRRQRIEDEDRTRKMYLENMRNDEEKRQREFDRKLAIAQLQGKAQEAGVRTAPVYANNDLNEMVQLGGDVEFMDANRTKAQRAWDEAQNKAKYDAEQKKQETLVGGRENVANIGATQRLRTGMDRADAAILIQEMKNNLMREVVSGKMSMDTAALLYRGMVDIHRAGIQGQSQALTAGQAEQSGDATEQAMVDLFGPNWKQVQSDVSGNLQSRMPHGDSNTGNYSRKKTTQSGGSQEKLSDEFLGQ